MSSRPLRDRKIAEISNISKDKKDGMGDDDKRIADPDYQAKNVMDLEDSEPDPSPSTSAVLTGSQPKQSERCPRKPQKLNLRWKKKNLLLNEQQLRFLGNEN
ncbi:hypothetical protein HHI36_007932 [Cryptolaemus montrouzieri]|uniref:Uncharacterized protein n=1 Tax=Cryptolaemus montrouzieri TaxID=559131 RepID=A0ABD2MRW6_9CUCU